jgi:hypothetical protein
MGEEEEEGAEEELLPIVPPAARAEEIKFPGGLTVELCGCSV